MVMAIDNLPKPTQCLFSQMNWLKKNEAPADSAPNEVTEYDIYSDSRFTGQVQQPQWPYAFLNAIADGLGTVDVTLVLRVEFYNTDHPFEPDWSKTDDATYHGGWIDDELVSLASLCLGVRLASGGMSRRFSDREPYGQPIKVGKRPPLTVYQYPRYYASGRARTAFAKRAQSHRVDPSHQTSTLRLAHPCLQPLSRRTVDIGMGRKPCMVTSGIRSRDWRK